MSDSPIDTIKKGYLASVGTDGWEPRNGLAALDAAFAAGEAVGRNKADRMWIALMRGARSE